MIPELVALKAHTQSPDSFWSGEIRDITLDLAGRGGGWGGGGGVNKMP